METSVSEGSPVGDASLSSAKGTAHDLARVKDTFYVGVLTIHIEIQDHMNPLKITYSSISGATASFELGSDDTLADLENCIRDLCQWQSLSFLSDNGEYLVDLGQSVREFTRIIAMDSGDRKKYEHWKERYPSVGQVLAAMEVEAFNPRSERFNVKWTLTTVPAVEPEEFDVLVGAQDPAIVTDIDRSHYVQVLGRLVELSENWNMTNLQLLQNFDPALKSFKHQFYRALLAVARGALHPVDPCHPEIGAYFKRNQHGIVIGCYITPGLAEYFDRNLQNSLNLPDLRLDKDWSRSTRYDVMSNLMGIASTVGTDLHKVGDRPGHKLDGAMSNEFCCTLFTIQLRLVCEVCPVRVNGDMPSDMVELLAESRGYRFDILRSCGNSWEFMLVENSEKDGDATKEIKGLQEHLNNSLTKASASGASGSLLVVAGVSGELASMLAPACRHFKEQANPKSVDFVLCAGLVR